MVEREVLAYIVDRMVQQYDDRLLWEQAELDTGDSVESYYAGERIRERAWEIEKLIEELPEDWNEEG